jgi:hypothetical protein
VYDILIIQFCTQGGISRTTTAMVIASLVKEFQLASEINHMKGIVPDDILNALRSQPFTTCSSSFTIGPIKLERLSLQVFQFVGRTMGISQREAPEKCPTFVGTGLTGKYFTRLGKLAMNKYTNVFGVLVSD